MVKIHLASYPLNNVLLRSPFTCKLSDVPQLLLWTCETMITMVFFFSPQQQCNVNPCANSGTCWTSGDSFYCACRPGFTGKMCEGKWNEVKYIDNILSSLKQNFAGMHLFSAICTVYHPVTGCYRTDPPFSTGEINTQSLVSEMGARRMCFVGLCCVW